jgi:hypothetical protein
VLSLATFEKPRFWALYAQHSGRAVGYSVHRGSWGFHAEGIQAIPPGYIPKQRKFGTSPNFRDEPSSGAVLRFAKPYESNSVAMQHDPQMIL